MLKNLVASQIRVMAFGHNTSKNIKKSLKNVIICTTATTVVQEEEELSWLLRTPSGPKIPVDRFF